MPAPLRIVLLGPPGAGKGTQAQKLVTEYKVAQISTGDILRAERKSGTAIGKEAQGFMDSGKLVPDELILGLVERELEKGIQGYILDGFPRTIPQADAMKHAGIKLDYVVEIAVDDAAIIERMSGRRAHLPSGRTYHIKYNPPKVAGQG